MYTLFLDTHDELITVSLLKDKEVYTCEKISEYSHSVHLLPLISNMLENKNITMQDIEKVVVVNGPGSFTGIRIGVTVAKTIAYSLSIPIYVISSLIMYLVSTEEIGKIMCTIEDSKGYYINAFDNEKEIIEESYVTDLSEYKSYKIIENKIDVLKTVEYATKNKEVNVHLVKANYVKKIEALK